MFFRKGDKKGDNSVTINTILSLRLFWKSILVPIYVVKYLSDMSRNVKTVWRKKRETKYSKVFLSGDRKDLNKVIIEGKTLIKYSQPFFTPLFFLFFYPPPFFSSPLFFKKNGHNFQIVHRNILNHILILFVLKRRIFWTYGFIHYLLRYLS